MKWLVQEFLNNQSNIIRVINALEELNVEYLIVNLNENNKMTVLDKEDKVPLDDSERILREFVQNADVMVYGSKTFALVADEMGLKPGSFMNEKFEFEEFRIALGNELLNNQFQVGELSELQPMGNKFFIRPTGNTKLFTGMVVSKNDFLQWQEREKTDNSPYNGQTLLISAFQEIIAEYRFFVVNQEIVTYSSYKVGGNIDTSCKPSKELLSYTEEMISKFPLSEAYVIDIAETSNGYKVVEYNNINTSGLYGCNEIAFIKAINSMEF